MCQPGEGAHLRLPMMAMMSTPDVALVTADLLFAGRLRATLGAGSLTLVRDGDVPSVGTVFVDLNGDVDARLALIAQLRARGGMRIIGFCQHDARAVRIRAMECGADQVVTNGTLQESALRLLTGASPATPEATRRPDHD